MLATRPALQTAASAPPWRWLSRFSTPWTTWATCGERCAVLRHAALWCSGSCQCRAVFLQCRAAHVLHSWLLHGTHGSTGSMHAAAPLCPAPHKCLLLSPPLSHLLPPLQRPSHPHVGGGLRLAAQAQRRHPRLRLPVRVACSDTGSSHPPARQSLLAASRSPAAPRKSLCQPHLARRPRGRPSTPTLGVTAP